MKRSPMRRIGTLALKLGFSLALTMLLLEGLLHMVPALIPSAYRRLYPLHGVGFIEPALLDRTPLTSVPLPLYVGSYVGPPPCDLVDYGVVDPARNPDPVRYPEVELRVDALGLPNASIPERVDVVLVGDSFAVAAGGTRPGGLQSMLVQSLGQSVYNLGVAALGPAQERWLLETQGLPKHPSLVLWFFFGGNDVLDMATMLFHLERGEDSFGKVHAARRPPTWRLPAILRYMVGTAREERRREPLPPLLLPNPAGGSQPVWMHPNYLLTLGKTTAQWEADPAWRATKDELREVNSLVAAAGARFVLVYIPSKAQAYLPYVEPNADLVHRMTSFRRPAPVTADPAAYLQQALAHRADLELLMRDFCAAEGIEYLSATPSLENLARRGELGFYAADTHWDLRGQQALLPALLDVLR